MKKLILIIILLKSLYATNYDIKCAGDLTYTTFTPLMMDWFYMGIFYDEDVMYTANLQDTPQAVFDNTSPACGGSGTQNILVEISCNVDCLDGFRTNTPSSTFSAVKSSSSGGYVNTVTIVNGYPCFDVQNTTLPTRFTHTFYDDDNINHPLSSDFKYGSVKVTTFSASQYGTTLTTAQAKQLKEVCTPPDPNAQIDYTAQLNQIITNTAPNFATVSKLTNIDNRAKKQDDDLGTFIQSKNIDTMMNIDSELDGFNTTFETTLSDTYSTYSDVFGFGGYGVAPNPISFTMFAREYKVFDPTVLNPHIDMIRNTFVIFAYLWGFIIVFKGT